MHQAYMREIQIEFKFGMEDKKLQYRGATVEPRIIRRRSREISRVLLYAARGPGPTLPTRGDAASCEECLLPDRDPSATGATAAPST